MAALSTIPIEKLEKVVQQYLRANKLILFVAVLVAVVGVTAMIVPFVEPEIFLGQRVVAGVILLMALSVMAHCRSIAYVGEYLKRVR